MALALAVIVGDCSLVKESVAVTGGIDLRGRIGAMGGIEEKVTYAMSRNLDLIVVPEANYKSLRFEDKELKDYFDSSVRGAKHFVELLEVTLQGEWMIDMTGI